MFLHLDWSQPGVNSAERTSFKVTHVYLMSNRQYQSQNREFRSEVSISSEITTRSVMDSQPT